MKYKYYFYDRGYDMESGRSLLKYEDNKWYVLDVYNDRWDYYTTYFDDYFPITLDILLKYKGWLPQHMPYLKDLIENYL